MPSVMVLIAAYNGAEYIQEQVLSILSQTGVDISVIISDDLSQDNTKEIIQSISNQEPRVTLMVPNHNSGSAGANFRRMFRSIDPGGFDYVALADQDDIWHPDKLVKAIEALRHSDRHGYSCAVESFWPKGKKRIIRQQSRTRMADFLFEGAGQGCTFLITHELFVRIRQFCTDHQAESESLYFHDWMIYLLARSWNFSWYFDPTPWLLYRQHTNNDIGSRGGPGAVKKRLEQVYDGWYRRQVSSALTLFFLQSENPLAWAQKFYNVFHQRDTVRRRIYLSWFFFLYGRRRLLDRVAMIGFALAGWL